MNLLNLFLLCFVMLFSSFSAQSKTAVLDLPAIMQVFNQSLAKAIDYELKNDPGVNKDTFLLISSLEKEISEQNSKLSAISPMDPEYAVLSLNRTHALNKMESLKRYMRAHSDRISKKIQEIVSAEIKNIATEIAMENKYSQVMHKQFLLYSDSQDISDLVKNKLVEKDFFSTKNIHQIYSAN